MAEVSRIKFKKNYRLFHIGDETNCEPERAKKLAEDGIVEIVGNLEIPPTGKAVKKQPEKTATRTADVKRPEATRTAIFKR